MATLDCSNEVTKAVNVVRRAAWILHDVGMSAATTVKDDIRFWRAYVRCAIEHASPLPTRPHEKRSAAVPAGLMRDLYELIFELYEKREDAALFKEPVDALELQVFDYYSRVERPMDLHTVLDGFTSRKYEDPESALRDLDLIWSNCAAFNGPDHAVTKLARQCQAWVKDGFTRLRASQLAPSDRVRALFDRVMQAESVQLLEEINGAVMRMDPSIIHEDDDGEKEILAERVTVGILDEFERIYRAFRRPGSAGSHESGRGSPVP